MPKVLTTAAQIKCSHQGTVTVSSAGQSVVEVDGSSVLVMGDLVGKSVSGCTLTPSQNSKPCTTTTSMIVGAATRMEAGGNAVLLETATGLTDSTPPGTWSVQDAGQSSVEAT
jgi:archaellum component FlaF (FlaF/FlaG flagellin family)